MNRGFVIAIDGPVASGKGTIAPQLAHKLNGFHIYTGGTYRAAALYCLRNNIDVNDSKAVINALQSINVDLQEGKVILNSENVTEELKKRDVANASAPVSVIKELRAKMVDAQRAVAVREMNNGKAVISEGRDTATRVFPDADFKIFLTASKEVRAKRRLEQYKTLDESTNFDEVLEDIRVRDKRDTEREIDPLSKNPKELGYFILDNSNQTEGETIEIIISELKRRSLL